MIKVSIVILLMAMNAPLQAGICAISPYAVGGESRLLQVPVSKAAGKAMRNDYITGIDEAIDDLLEILAKKHIENQAKKITKIRKFFVMFRHFSELYTKQGALPPSVEELAFLPGKVVDALRNDNTEKALKFLDRLKDALSKKNRRKIFHDIQELRVASSDKIRQNVQLSKDEIRSLGAKDSLSFEEFHDLKKAVRRFVYLLKYRVKIRGEEDVQSLVEAHSVLVDLLGITTDEIAGLKLSMSREELAAKVFTVTPEVKQKITEFLDAVVTVADF